MWFNVSFLLGGATRSIDLISILELGSMTSLNNLPPGVYLSVSSSLRVHDMLPIESTTGM